MFYSSLPFLSHLVGLFSCFKYDIFVKISIYLNFMVATAVHSQIHLGTTQRWVNMIKILWNINANISASLLPITETGTSKISSFSVSCFSSNSSALNDCNKKNALFKNRLPREVNKEVGSQHSFASGKRLPRPSRRDAFQHERIAGIPSKWTSVGLLCKYSTHALRTHMGHIPVPSVSV